MKRTNVILDEKLLEDARRVTGERTYSGAITKALEEIVRRRRFEQSFMKVAELAAKDELFYPGFVEENFPEVAAEVKRLERQKVSAHAARVATPKKKRRAAR